uniref:Uncharacterized protein n=1 Tax=viral metagenome TaxID=1070528 RepID=A0A6M3L7Y2_9ZZZZ
MVIKIGSKRFEVIFQKQACKDHGTESSGRMSDWHQRIWIDTDQRSFNSIESDLWHETIEAIDKVFDLRLSHQTITTLGSGIHQAVQQKTFWKEFHGKYSDNR